MLKTLKILRAIILLPVALPMILGLFGTMWLASRIARTDRKRAAWLLLRLATFLRRMPSAKTKSSRETGALLVAPALLLQGAPWQRVQRWLEPNSRMAKVGFEFYFAEQRFDQALEAAADWCRATESAVADCQDEMRAFFAKHSADLSPPARSEMWLQHSQAELATWEANPQGKRPGIFNLKAKPPRFVRFLNYYDSHLALRATRWIATRDLNSTPIKREFESQRDDDINWMGLPQFHVSDASLEQLGINATKLAAIRRQAMGQ